MTKRNSLSKVILFLALTALMCLVCFSAVADVEIQDHIWDNGTYKSPANCSHGQIWVFHCTVPGCGATKEAEVGSPDMNAHDWGDWYVDKEPTCTETGVRKRVCKNVSHHFDTQTIAALGHLWDDGVVTKAPTCLEPGEKTYTCKRDARHTKVEAVNALDHDWGPWQDIGVVTCTTGGTQKRVCKRDASHVEYRELQPTGHDWGPWTVVIPATCTTNGLEERVCKKCGLLEQRTINATGHNWDNGVVIKKPTLTEEGLKRYTCKNDPSHTKDEKLGKQTIVGTLCAFGIRLKESNLYPYNSDKWYMYTPFDASQEGTQTYEVVLADRYIPGTIDLTVRDGYLTVYEPKIQGNTLTYNLKFFTVLNKITDLTQYEPEQLLHLNMEFNKPMNIQDTFGDDRSLVLYLCSRVSATFDDRWTFLQYNSTVHQRILENMKWLMQTDLF